MKTPLVNKILKFGFFAFLFIAAAGVSAYIALTFVIESEDVVIIPELKDKDVLYALEILSDMGLNTKVKSIEYHSTTPRNHIIDQYPEPGTEIKKGRDVKITVSRGPKSIVMPNLFGLPVRQARIILEENGLCIDKISKTRSRTGKQDEIISQFPLAGKIVERDNCINLLVVSGQHEKAYLLPDYKGILLTDVLTQLDQYRLISGKIQHVALKQMPENAVVDQQPRAGKRVTTGQRIGFVINRPTHSKNDKNNDGRHVFRYRLEKGFLKQKVRAVLKFDGVSVDIYHQLMKPGKELWLFIPDIDNSTLFLYVDDSLVETRVY